VPHQPLYTSSGTQPTYKTLKYKACPSRSYDLQWAELDRLRSFLASLAKFEPRLDGSPTLEVADPRGLRGRALKRVEDLLDALFCAYTALHIWYWGEAGCRCFGDRETGYILVPVKPGGPVAQAKPAAAPRRCQFSSRIAARARSGGLSPPRWSQKPA
jgi:predicted RNase H-like nuclease